uniref:Uncharacterized protein n=1 Tax=Oryza punctata TaxID=4537 RepID=A0A0E0L295_ORYPU
MDKEPMMNVVFNTGDGDLVVLAFNATGMRTGPDRSEEDMTAEVMIIEFVQRREIKRGVVTIH